MRRPANPSGPQLSGGVRRRDYLKRSDPRGAGAAGGEIIAPPRFRGAPRRDRSSRPSPGWLRADIGTNLARRLGGIARPFGISDPVAVAAHSNPDAATSRGLRSLAGGGPSPSGEMRTLIKISARCCRKLGQPRSLNKFRLCKAVRQSRTNTPSAGIRSVCDPRPVLRRQGAMRLRCRGVGAVGGGIRTAPNSSGPGQIRAPMPPAAAARAERTTPRRFTRPARHFAPTCNEAGDRSRPSYLHAAKGCSSSAPRSGAAGTASSCATIRADLTLPTPPRVV